MPPTSCSKHVPLWILALMAAVAAVRPVAAAESQWWIANRPADHARADARGVEVRADGVLQLGPRVESAPADSVSVLWTIVPFGDGVAVAGERGAVLRARAGEAPRPWLRLPVGQVLCLVRDGDGLLAGTAPDGIVYRIGARGDTATFARTGERYVWALAPAGSGGWYAATGTTGKLLLLTRGRSEIVFDSDESNLVSLIADGRGGAYAGGDSRGRVFHAARGGAVRTLFDASEDEIRALTIGRDGALYAAALGAPAVAADREEDGPRPAAPAPAGTRATVYRIVPDSTVTTWWTSTQGLVYALAPPPGAGEPGIVAATGGRAAILSIPRANGASQWFASPDGPITALAAETSGALWAVASNPARVWWLGPERAARGELTSAVLDARRHARFGRMQWNGDAGGGRVALFTRSGNTDTADSTWSPWQGGATGPEGRRIESPPARYLQWRLELAGGRPQVESVEASWREQNQPPRIEELTVSPQGSGFREGEMVPRSEPVTQTLPGGQKVEMSIPSATTPRQLRELPEWARGVRTIQWRGSDPNGDALRYEIEARREGGDAWFPVARDLAQTGYAWDTRALADGRYRVRVRATDARDNAWGEEAVVEAVSETFAVDNTPPEVAALEARGEAGAVAVSGRAVDAGSTLTRIEIALDSGDWRLVSPEGGLADDRALDFRVRVPGVSPGEHSVSVRAIDRAGNGTTRAVRVTVPRAR